MKKNLPFLLIVFITLVTIWSCGNRLEPKGFAISPAEDGEENSVNGITRSTSGFLTRPSSILLTGNPNYRLATIYKVNFNEDSTTFIGSNDFHFNYSDLAQSDGNNWNYNYLPGLAAVYGYNMVNISHFNVETQTKKNFFENPVLIKTLYYPAYSQDTLNYQSVSRKHYLISVYDEDTNKDGFINTNDLRRFYAFDSNADKRSAMVPMNYSVFKSEYDPANDFLFVFAKLDENNNGIAEDLEPINVFWVDMKDPTKTGIQY